MLFSTLILALVGASLGYLLLALWLVARFRIQPEPVSSRVAWPPVTILKPVCGLDAKLEDNLRSFCVQNYPEYQVVFGVADPHDAALPVLRRLVAEYPDRNLTIVVDGRQFGANAKLSNLTNMLARARHDLLVIADSDMWVGPELLSTVVRTFDDGQIGAATCLYTGVALDGVASRLAADFINESFVPSVLVANRFEPLRYCFGATMAIRRKILAEIGGFERLSNYLADDYMLGKLVSDAGYRVALVPYMVQNIVSEAGVRTLFTHELRWARTVRTVRPVGYALSIVTQTVPMSLLALVQSPWKGTALALFVAALSGRYALHIVARRKFGLPLELDFWRLLLREAMSLAVWIGCFCGRGIQWRQGRFTVQRNGELVRLQRAEL